mmetsp:Transcript_69021/g.136807  ORF Transcript_69021/g.136807 Transcript_69021/m.136807 type:complete len:271 (-) Transcript_69021:108-920(-)
MCPNKRHLNTMPLAGAINIWYGAQYTHTLVINTDMPVGAENQHPYDRRGWCIFERRLSALIKDAVSYLELKQMSGTKTSWLDIRTECVASRPAPMAPDAFEAMLLAGVEKEAAKAGSGIKFTSGKDLTDVVIPQYKQSFLRLMGGAETLWYDSLGWGDQEAEALAAALTYVDKHSEPRLKTLKLHRNQISDTGAAAIAKVLSDTRVPLKDIRLARNKIADAGAAAMVKALYETKAPLERLDLGTNRISSSGKAALREAAASIPSLKKIVV